MQYSVVSTGSKQYIVEEGDIIDVELLDPTKKMFTLDTLLRVSDDTVEIGEPVLSTGVEVEVVDQVKGDKKRGVKYMPGGYRKKFGHRQKYTRVRIVKL